MFPCSICFDPLVSEESCETCCIPCGHVFHFHCLSDWFNHGRNTSCPQCRNFFSQQQMIKLFFNDGNDRNDESTRSQSRQRSGWTDSNEKNKQQLHIVLRNNSQWITRISDNVLQAKQLLQSSADDYDYDEMIHLVFLFLQDMDLAVKNLNSTNVKLNKEVSDNFLYLKNQKSLHSRFQEKFDRVTDHLQEKIRILESRIIDRSVVINRLESKIKNQSSNATTYKWVIASLILVCVAVHSSPCPVCPPPSCPSFSYLPTFFIALSFFTFCYFCIRYTSYLLSVACNSFKKCFVRILNLNNLNFH